MPILYNCHHDGDQYRITKFDSLGEVQSSYLCTESECDCPAGNRDTCRHRQMLPLFIHKGAIDTHWFYDFDRKGWVMNEIASPEPAISPPPEIADAVGEQRIRRRV